MLSARQQHAFAYDKKLDGTPLTKEEREKLLTQFLPKVGTTSGASKDGLPALGPGGRLRAKQKQPAATTTAADASGKTPRTRSIRRERRKPIRNTFWHSVYVGVYVGLHFFFSIWLRLRKGYRALRHRARAISLHHNRTPELIRSDIKNLNKVPNHLSVILELPKDEDRRAAVGRLLQDVGELTAWCASIGIPLLSIYERTGILKRYIPQVHSDISLTLTSYFPRSNRPLLSLRAPNEPAFSPPVTPPDGSVDADSPAQITVLLISEEDGRSTLVDLTKVLATMAQRDKISAADITADVIDAELEASVMGEPDLLILFGPEVVLQGYPPWQVRLTEIFHQPDYNEGVSYPVFMRALNKFSGAQMRFGK